MLALYFFMVFFNIAGGFLTNLAGFVIPGYYSMQALFTASKADDTQVCAVQLGFGQPIKTRAPANDIPSG